jgi:hypothetical protein
MITGAGRGSLDTPAVPGGSRAPRPNMWAAAGATAACVAVGIALVFLYPDSYQQDGGTHYLYARWAWDDPRHLVDVWGRPLFTLLYSVPALLGGYPTAKLLTVGIAAATGWQTWRLATDHGLGRPALVIPFLWLQPSFLLLSSETMTEPLFALLLVVALRLQRRGNRIPAAFVISASTLARPEGFFVCALWGVWLLIEPRGAGGSLPVRIRSAAYLAAFPVLWWFAALAITHDPAFLRHNWPANWSAIRAVYGRGLPLNYFYRRAEIIAPLLQIPFALGVVVAVVRRRLVLELATVGMLFVLHSVLWAVGAFGSAGYPRYFVCVAPAIALLTLVGWNTIFDAVRAVLGRPARVVEAAATVGVLGLSALTAVTYVDGMPWSRDAWLIDHAYTWFRAHPEPVRAFAGSQADMWIRFGYNPRLTAAQPGPARGVLGSLRSAPKGTLVVWDAETGPVFFGGVTADSIIALGYTPLHIVSDTLFGRFIPHLGRGSFFAHAMPWSWNQPRIQRIALLYK